MKSCDQAIRSFKRAAETAKSVSPDSMSSLNPTSKVLEIAADLLAARIATAKNAKELAQELLRMGIAHEDALAYDEPP
ncbi:MAG: hypothetical protein ABJC10_05310 [Acidobacteriota bacterium]